MAPKAGIRGCLGVCVCVCVCAACVRRGYRRATAGCDGGGKRGDGMKRMHRGEEIAPEPACKQGRGTHTHGAVNQL